MSFMNLFNSKKTEISSDNKEDSQIVPFDSNKKEKHRFAEYLISRGLVPRAHVNMALAEQRITKDRLGAILVRQGLLAHDTMIVSVLDFQSETIAVERVSSTRIPLDILERYKIIVSARTDESIYIGTTSEEEEVRYIVKEYYPDKKIVFVAFLPEVFQEFIDSLRRTANTSIIHEEARPEDVMEQMIYKALAQDISDIHIEPKSSSYSVYFRHLGERMHFHEGSIDEYNTIRSQIKDRGRMDLAEDRIGQDGGFQIEYSGRYIDLRVATIPEKEGEKIVIRVLNPDRVRPTIEALGISRIDHWKRGLSLANGLNLICGETGSGKTTTLNASIRSLNRITKAIYTVEDPVEYSIPGITQVSINNNVGLDYPRAIRNFMRADPDVIVVGEIRDEETARNAIKAAETGHLVIATLHTSSIVSTISRLRDIGIAPYELRFILRAILVQKLVKVICHQCNGTGHQHDQMCPVCLGTGYSDRTVVSECQSFPNASDVDYIIDMMKGDTEDAKKKTFNWPTMIDDGIDKMLRRVTSYEELQSKFGAAVEERIREMNIDPEEYLLPKSLIHNS